MDSLSFDNIKYILFLACTIVGANLLDVCISDNFPIGTAAKDTYYPCEEQYKEANFIAITSDFALIPNLLAKGHKKPTINEKKTNALTSFR